MIHNIKDYKLNYIPPQSFMCYCIVPALLKLSGLLINNYGYLLIYLYFCRRLQERERIGELGCPEVWGYSPRVKEPE